jgi:hypothetical protein
MVNEKEALEFLMQQFSPEVLDINGAQYTTKQLSRVKEPTPDALMVKSLKAIVDFIESGVDIEQDIYIHIVDEKNVHVFGGLNKDMSRPFFMQAKAEPTRFRFNQYMEAEETVIALQAMTTEVYPKQTDKAALLSFIGTMKEFHESNIADDGISQSATVKTGIAAVGEKTAPNPVTLAPYRTFIEVEQPVSTFVLRLNEGCRVALYEADGGAWERQAVENIKAYLEKELEAGDTCRAFKVVIIA